MTEAPQIPFTTLFDVEVDGIRRSLTLYASYDFRRHPRNYGIHSAELCFAVQRGACRVEWSFNTGWWAKPLRDERYDKVEKIGHWLADGTGAITSHSPEPLYEGHEVSHTDCKWTGGVCYSSDAWLASGELFAQFVSSPEGLWPDLERRLVEVEKQVELEREAKRNFS